MNWAQKCADLTKTADKVIISGREKATDAICESLNLCSIGAGSRQYSAGGQLSSELPSASNGECYCHDPYGPGGGSEWTLWARFLYGFSSVICLLLNLHPMISSSNPSVAWLSYLVWQRKDKTTDYKMLRFCCSLQPVEEPPWPQSQPRHM